MSSKVTIYGNGLVFCSVCAPKDMSKEELAKEVNLQNPSGVLPWGISEEKFADGTDNPHQCEKSENLHYLFNC